MTLFIAASALAEPQSTAYEALKVVGTQYNRAALNRIISVTGTDGDPQPQRWRVLIADRNAPGGVRELQVAGGRIVGDSTPGAAGSGPAATINTSRLNLDSSGAFSVANYTADKSHTNFTTVDYTLRSNERGVPVWDITLQDDKRRPVGRMHISAMKGNVTRVEGMYAGGNMVGGQPSQPVGRVGPPPVEEANDGIDDSDLEAEDSDENPVKAEVKRMFRRTKRDAQRMFERVRGSFDDFMRRS